MPESASRIFNIPASAPFLPVLIRALLDGRLIPGFPRAGDPLALSQATLYLPTRRACRQARDMFAEIGGHDAAILPRIVAIGDIDEDEFVFADAQGGLPVDILDLPPALGATERRLLLARLILAWAKAPALRGAEGTALVAGTPASALALADDLARLIDDMTTRKIGWERLDTLVPDDFDPYWARSLDFLKIIRDQWRKFLVDSDTIEPAARRDRLIEAETARIARTGAPVIAAGSTGSIPATAALLSAIAKLPQGAVVLPGLDLALDDDAWATISGRDGASAHDGGAPVAGHPQFAMQALLARIGVARAQVQPLADDTPRERIVSEALRPAATTDRWLSRTKTPAFAADCDHAFKQVTVIEAASVEDEALAIAVALRETVEQPGKTAALATPDRGLARRVVAALQRWDVPVYDSGGDPLPDTSAGRFARLAADAALSGLAPVPLLALLKHALLRLSASEGHFVRPVAALEMAVLRGPRPATGSTGLAKAITSFRDDLAQFRRDPGSIFHRRDPRTKIADDDLSTAIDMVTKLGAAIAPLESARGTSLPLAQWVALHRDVVAALSFDGERGVAMEGADGSALTQLFDDMTSSGAAADFFVAASDYPDIFRAVASGRVVRRRDMPDMPVRIFGLLEARLQSVDRLVLGGLSEGIWPPESRSDPWLSRPMRQKLGLDLPERRIGLAAHDFAQGLGAPEIILTRAAKVGGAPAVASRFLQRLGAIGGAARWSAATQRGQHYLALARSLDEPQGVVQPAKRPAPRPPLEARPAGLSVTDIEHWLRDPYTIYAKHILALAPLDPVDAAPGATDRGTVIHGAIGEFTQTYAAELPPDPYAALVAIGEKHFAPLKDFPEARAFWWPRFLRIAQWFAGWEAERRPHLAAIYGEIRGRLTIDGARPFTVSARADRIERNRDGGYVVVDYKTGAARTEKQVRTGLAPQLTLEAAILQAGGFENVTPGSVDQLLYVTLKGGEPAGENKPIKFKDGTTDEQAALASARLAGLVAKFNDPAMPYYALVSPMWTTRYGDYDHLARVKEWSTGGDDGDAA